MTKRFERKAIPKPVSDLKPGTPEWFEGMAVSIQVCFETVQRNGGGGLDRLIEVLRPAVEAEIWKVWPEDAPLKTGAAYFEYITGEPYADLIRWVKLRDEELATMMMANLHAGKAGRPEAGEINNNVINSPKQGNSAPYTLNRLKRTRPDLLEQVVAGDLSANAAAIEAGFRTKMVQVKPDPEAVQRMLDRHLPGWKIYKDED